MTTGYVTFRLADRVFATPLDEVREILRLSGLDALPGMVPPLAGVVVLRGAPLPVFDLRGPGAPDDRGDVLVLQRPAGELVGVAVDGAEAVLGSDELADPTPAPASLPAYVVEVRRGANGPVLVVDLERLLDTVAEGWQAALPASV